MPNFGKSSSRAPHGAGRGSNFKPREDGRGGRAPHRQSRDEAPRGKRTPFFEQGPARSERPARDDRGFDRGNDRVEKGYREGRGSRPVDREMRGGREDRGRDWTPSSPTAGGRKPRYNADDRARRAGGFNDRDERPAREGRSYGDRDSRPQRSFGDRDRNFGDRPARGNFGDRDARPKRDFGDRDSRPQRSFGDRDRNFGDRDRNRDERPARGGFGDRDRNFGDRPARGNFGDRDARPKRDFGDRDRSRDERPARRDFDRPDRADRVARDRSRDDSFRGARDKNPNKKAFFEDKVLERLESVEASDAVIVNSFAEMDLHPRLIEALSAMGAESPFPIQAATIPAAIGGQDVLGRGKTGSGKTIAFSIPLITKLIAGGSQPRAAGKPRALILAPTRELADQIDRTVHALAKPVGFYSVCIYGGVPQRKQEHAMSRGVDIVVATPGRLEDLMAQGIIDLSAVETLVVDEADHMCDLGFIEGVRRIMRAAGDSQKLLFSATLDREVDSLVKEFLPNPYVYEVPNEENDTANITHRVLTVEPDDRSAVLLRLVQGEGKSLIFTRTKMTAERLAESLTEAGVPAARLHGDLNQNQRNRNLERFTKGQVRVLVATDVAARGIHVDDVKLVIQVDPPEEYKTYLHRAGRTGRGHASGTVVTLIFRSRFRRMEDLLRRADRDGIFSDVRPSSALLEELAGPIAPPPVQDILDFGDSRGGRGGHGGSRGDRQGGGKRSNYGGNGRGRWSDRPEGSPRPRDKKKFESRAARD
ncbi:MAG: DEAD/DEAH box helicase [Actinomycetales bacterium]|nr:DEAD/DEAH box helicase [Actinomycetales bacterium]